jgi:hypothetical protein
MLPKRIDKTTSFYYLIILQIFIDYHGEIISKPTNGRCVESHRGIKNGVPDQNIPKKHPTQNPRHIQHLNNFSKKSFVDKCSRIGFRIDPYFRIKQTPIKTKD